MILNQLNEREVFEIENANKLNHIKDINFVKKISKQLKIFTNTRDPFPILILSINNTIRYFINFSMMN